MKRHHQRERGAVLLLVLLGSMTVTILAGAFVQMGIAEQRFSERSQGGVQAFYLSESAIDRGLTWLRGQLVPPQWVDRRVLFGGWQGLGQGSYMTTLDPDDNNPLSQIKRFTIEGWGVSGPRATPLALRQNRMIVQTESFAQYAYFTNSERSWPNGLQVYFITGDIIEGPTHTNGQFSMYGRPVFQGPVSSVNRTINLWGGNQVTQPVFAEPPKLGVPPKKFPTSYPTSIIESAQSGGTVLRGDTAVTLLANGTMRVTNARAGLRDRVMPLPGNGVLYVDGGNVALQGTLKGQLTIGSSGDVRVVDSVTYADNPKINPKSKDLLGIVAGQNVTVAKEAPANVKVEASIMALNRSFGVEGWWERPPRGTLTVNGGIIQANRGIVGSFNGNTGTKLSGYTKDYHYDPRLRTMSPPSFPTTGDYKTLVWQEQTS
ncbi:MAG: DUF4900 domain-containing protein [Candidatus Omnitrophica bacterium]|nr:DUF4900 domain-containing protein [Candidatus Omnitrophota bacterium]